MFFFVISGDVLYTVAVNGDIGRVRLAYIFFFLHLSLCLSRSIRVIWCRVVACLVPLGLLLDVVYAC